MPPPISPPRGSIELEYYDTGDQVHYYRSGKCKGCLYAETVLTRIGKWRSGVVQNPGGSSENSPRYDASSKPRDWPTQPLTRDSLQIKDLADGEDYLIPSDDIRKKG